MTVSVAFELCFHFISTTQSGHFTLLSLHFIAEHQADELDWFSKFFVSTAWEQNQSFLFSNRHSISFRSAARNHIRKCLVLFIIGQLLFWLVVLISQCNKINAVCTSASNSWAVANRKSIFKLQFLLIKTTPQLSNKLQTVIATLRKKINKKEKKQYHQYNQKTVVNYNNKVKHKYCKEKSAKKRVKKSSKKSKTKETKKWKYD